MSEPLLLQAYRKQKTERPPVWFMRQAGRYLPEYLELRGKYSINEIINNAELATEVTMQPMRRFSFDASIIFADLLTPLQGLGFEFDFLEGEGPKVFEPIAKTSDVEKLKDFDPETAVKSTLDAISNMRRYVDSVNKAIIGFSGAPFTLSSYLIEGKSNPKLNATKIFMFQNQAAWESLQRKLVVALRDYLLAQINAGAQAIQIFDSWLGGMGVQQYRVYVKPYLEQLVNSIKEQSDVPIVFFATAVNHLYPEFKTLKVDVIGVDWRQSLKSVNDIYNSQFALQGNLDPLLLYADWEQIKLETESILEQVKDIEGFVFNLGHGILPKTPVENVEKLVEFLNQGKFD